MKPERINYTITENGKYVAHSANMPLLVQAESFEQMKTMIRELAKCFSENLQTIIADDLFEYVEKPDEFTKAVSMASKRSVGAKLSNGKDYE